MNAPAPRPVDACVGLGGNLGDAARAIEGAIDSISTLPGTRLRARSAFFRTAPVDADGPLFVNAVVRIDTCLGAFELLDALRRIEDEHGRERPYRNAPRTLDLDLLLYGRFVVDHERLTVPHPRMHGRAFVLAPLLDVFPDAEIPACGSVRELLADLVDQPIERLPP